MYSHRIKAHHHYSLPKLCTDFFIADIIYRGPDPSRGIEFLLKKHIHSPLSHHTEMLLLLNDNPGIMNEVLAIDGQ